MIVYSNNRNCGYDDEGRRYSSERRTNRANAVGSYQTIRVCGKLHFENGKVLDAEGNKVMLIEE